MAVNLAVLVVFAIWAYTNGDTHNIYRATDNSRNICGMKKTPTEEFPYAYFYNPTTGNLKNRICVKECPSYNNGTLSPLNCFTNPARSNCTYSAVIAQNGSFSSNFSSSDFIGYGSHQVINRVCIPEV